MEVYEGYSIHNGSVLASIAKVRFDFGIPSLTTQRLRALAERLQTEDEAPVEPEQVVLVAESLPLALIAGAIPGIEVVGVAIGGYVDESELAAVEALIPKTGASFPIVAGLGESFVRDAAEYEIILLDARAGRAIVAPDAYVVSRFQATPNRKRYLLGGAHVPAKTASDNRIVAVYTRAAALSDIATGIEQGSDGICITHENAILSTDSISSASDQLAHLREVVDLAGGQPMLLDLSPEALAYSALIEIAAGTPLSIPADNLDSASSLRDCIQMAANYADGFDATVSGSSTNSPKILFAPRAPGDPGDVPESMNHLAGTWLRDEWRHYDFAYLFTVMGVTARAGLPVIVSTSAEWRSEIEDLVRFGVSGVVVDPSDAADVKDAIREL